MAKKYTTVKLGDAQVAYRELKERSSATLTNTVKAKGGTCEVLMSFDSVAWKRNCIFLNRNEWIRPVKAKKLIGEVREAGKTTRLAMTPAYAAMVMSL